MLEAPQGTEAWLRERLGKATASRISEVVARTKTGWGASRANYMAELIAERLTGVPAEQYVSPAMKWGTEKQEEAFAAYEFYRDLEKARKEGLIQEVGFCPHPNIPMAGASPDRLVGAKGLVETKCPLTATHIETLLGASIPDKYIVQMQFQMACTGRQWGDWVSFDPRMPERMRLFVKRVPRDDERIDYLEKEVKVFLAELDERVKDLEALYDGSAPRERLRAALKASA